MTTLRYIDHPFNNDNRKYDYSEYPISDRAEYSVIIDMIAPNSKVIDLGCGNGSLLTRLKKEKNAVDTGIEISESGVTACKQRGLNVHQGNIDERLPYNDDTFDYSVCNVTIQMVMYPEILLKEMRRISRFQIISFPNFANWRNRIELLFYGRMPQHMLFGYSWYSTGHIHQLSSSDFLDLVTDIGGLSVKECKVPYIQHPLKRFVMKHFPSLFQILFIYLLEKK
jgi:methionine biosynthesis protein MetW